MPTLFHSICKFCLESYTAGVSDLSSRWMFSWRCTGDTLSLSLPHNKKCAHHGAAVTPYTRTVRQTPNPASVYILPKLCGWMSTCVEGAQISAALLHRSLAMCFRESLFWGCFGWVSDLVGSAGLWLCAWSAGSACARSWLAGGASDACTAEMCSILLYSVQLMEPSSTRSWLRSGLLGSRTEEPQLLASVDVSVQTACWLYPFTVTHLAAVSCRAVSLDLIYHRFHQSAALPSHQAGFFINVQKAW